MQDSDKASFEVLLRGIADVFSSTKTIIVNRPMLQVYFMSLGDYSYQQVEWAIGEHLKDAIDGKFFPKPANIIKHLQANELSPEEQAEIAWAEIMQCLRKNGAYGGMKIENKQAIAAFKAFTTWKEFCAMDASKMVWAKKEFISVYSTYDKTPLEMLPGSLPGLVELHNHKDKHASLGVQSAGDIIDKLMTKRLDNKQQ
tara:strand:- start:14712 stop:15308 length:597 start_codon:yes stop_codon:yes gene_type:complete